MVYICAASTCSEKVNSTHQCSITNQSSCQDFENGSLPSSYDMKVCQKFYTWPFMYP